MAASRLWLLAVIGAIAVTTASLATAGPHGRHWRDDFHHGHEHRHWRSGHWHHGDHGGRFGWWWISAGSWYFYPAPVYPYPAPYVTYAPPVIIEREPVPVTTVPPAETVWYYCESSRSYYPYVSNCSEGWQTVPAQPGDADAR